MDFVIMTDIMQLAGMCLIKLNILFFFIFVHDLIPFGQA